MKAGDLITLSDAWASWYSYRYKSDPYTRDQINVFDKISNQEITLVRGELFVFLARPRPGAHALLFRQRTTRIIQILVQNSAEFCCHALVS